MPVALAFRVEQLWLDVDRPIQTRAPRGVRAGGAKADRSTTDRQMEFRMPAPTPDPVPQPAIQPAVERPAPAMVAAPMPDPRSDPAPVAPPFGAWLLQQANRSGTLGELARATKLDRLFPRRGDAAAVRARFNAVGADGDAFEALDDAEREYDRAVS